jgi:type IX secretion system substrate protein
MKRSIVSLFILCISLSAQPANYLDYLPLQVGNVWVYSCSQSGNPPACGMCTKRIRAAITNTSIINGHIYYQVSVSIIHISGICSFCNSNIPILNSNIRIDSISGNVLEYTSNSGCSYRPNEILHDSLRARLLDSVRYDCLPPAQWTAYVCRDTSNMIIFGQSRQSRAYSVQGFESGWGRGYVKGLGITNGGTGSILCNNYTQLLGCVINGVVYGDTGFVVGINNIYSEIPESFSLSQNYPNPFNPSTNIKFAVPAPSPLERVGVRLVIYDVIGREVQTLVNEHLQPGTYEVEFDASNFSSGVYYYTLLSGNYFETKKMVLLR